MSERRFGTWRLVGALAGVAAVLLTWSGTVTSQGQTLPPAGVRLALVNVPDDIVRPMLPLFQQQTGLSAEIVYTGPDPFAVARAGRADLVIAHYGHEGVEPFVVEGHGQWPQIVFSNQMALFGPPADPAGVRGLTDLSEAFRRIAATKSRFVVNSRPGAKYLEEIMAQGVDQSDKAAWYFDGGLDNAAAVQRAATTGGYVLWGVPPFLRLKRQMALPLEPLVVAAPLLQRMMVSVVVRPADTRPVRDAAAKAFQAYLLSAKTQAWIAAFRYPDLNQQVWWPAGRHNSARD